MYHRPGTLVIVYLFPPIYSAYLCQKHAHYFWCTLAKMNNLFGADENRPE